LPAEQLHAGVGLAGLDGDQVTAYADDDDAGHVSAAYICPTKPDRSDLLDLRRRGWATRVPSHPRRDRAPLLVGVGVVA
jgi:hypothetical protein